ncbi:MAG: acetylserotonin O-methyltransferase [Acidobacteriota bacterium]|nr:acetylserotonin O-methyltransferase [Acidobacteriota bacterium]
MKDSSLPPPPIELLELATAYQRAKTLFALVETGLPTLLARGPVPFEEAAAALGLHRVAADRFFNACAALGLLERAGGGVANTPLSARFLVKGETAYLGDFLLKYDQESYPRWNDLTRKLREWRPSATDDEPPAEEDQGVAGMSARHNYSLLVGHALASAYDFSQHRALLDLGGGTGAYSLALCRAYEHLRALVLDLPHVAELASQYVSASGLSSRVVVLAGDFEEEGLPEGFDVALLADLLSVSSEGTNRELLRKIYERLPEDGAVIISGWILDDTRTAPLVPVLFCLEDINWRAPDVERSASTYAGWLAEAGFVVIAHKEYCPPTSLIVGRKTVGPASRR